MKQADANHKDEEPKTSVDRDALTRAEGALIVLARALAREAAREASKVGQLKIIDPTSANTWLTVFGTMLALYLLGM